VASVEEAREATTGRERLDQDIVQFVIDDKTCSSKVDRVDDFV
jgi:hypothetical protein